MWDVSAQWPSAPRSHGGMEQRRRKRDGLSRRYAVHVPGVRFWFWPLLAELSAVLLPRRNCGGVIYPAPKSCCRVRRAPRVIFALRFEELVWASRKAFHFRGATRVQVFVRDNDVEQALRVLKKRMQREGVFREMRRRRFYEKPSDRVTREKAEAVRRARKLARKQAIRDGLIAAPIRKPPTDSKRKPDSRVNIAGPNAGRSADRNS
jgi:small subunit ribosomal protein S21